MKMYIDGHGTHVERSRHGSIWYKHPVTKNDCMQVIKSVRLGYQTKLGKISQCNTMVKEFLEKFATTDINIRIRYTDQGTEPRSHNVIVGFIFICEEKNSDWGEQRLQELLDKIIEL